MALDTDRPDGDRGPERSRRSPQRLLDSLSPSRGNEDHNHSLDKVIFGVTAVIALGFVVWGFVGTQSLYDSSGNALDWVMKYLGWLFVVLASLFVVFVIWLAISRYGNIPLGHDNETPEFTTVSWIAMMFSAGMGIGLMFYGVAEPLFHYINPPPATDAAIQVAALNGDSTPAQVQAAQSAASDTAMATTLFHWSLHPWAIYAVVGVVIAYGTFRKGRAQLISSAFIPLIGRRRAEGPAGRIIDILAIFATLFGSAASLGLGALQISFGMEYRGWVDAVGSTVLVMIIAVLTVCFIASATSGISRGIQWLSNFNMVLALALALFVFVVGPTILILDMLPTGLGNYLSFLPDLASRTDASGGADLATWLGDWTVFYWAWWISWTPFVGMFIARISRGRTIRQFVTGVLLVPSLVSLVWFAVFGGAAIFEQQRNGNVAPDGAVSFDGALFQLLDQYPIASVTSVVVMVLVAVFFVSGADAASLVMGTLSERGNTEPSRPTVIFWGGLTGAVAAVMLVAGNSVESDAVGNVALEGLKQITIVSAVPFVLIMGLLMVALMRDLRDDPMMLRYQRGEKAVERAVIEGVTRHGDEFSITVQEERGTTEPNRPTEPRPPSTDSG